MVRFAAAEDEILAILGLDDFEAFEPYFLSFAESCAALQAAADERLLEVDLSCS